MSRRKLLFVERHTNGPRLYVGGQRVHHGTTGLALLGGAILLKRKPALLVGALMMAHDRKDLRQWLVRETLPNIGADELLTTKRAGLILQTSPKR